MNIHEAHKQLQIHVSSPREKLLTHNYFFTPLSEVEKGEM